MADIDSKEHPKFEPYKWAFSKSDSVTVPARALLSFAETVQAITSGCEVILQIAEKESLDDESREDGDPPLYLGRYRTAAMVRLVQMNMGMLCGEAERLNDWVYEVLTPEGRASHYKNAVCRLEAHKEKLPRMDD